MVKKIRKKRKPMTEDQRQASAERLKKARASRAEKNPNYGKSGIHSSLHNLDEDDDFHPDKIKEWIKIQKDIVSSEKKNERNNVKGAIARRISHENYIKIMQIYLRDGVWIGLFYGENQESKLQPTCSKLAYHHDGPYKGMVKRNVGVWYSDINCAYTKEMFEFDRSG
jgi:hypothetical protein|tara:strand:+ start:6874 stop:7377 length:504 start_codon:yes stop_codon:yes gene_type:complete